MHQDDNELLTKHIHPMELRLKGVEKDVEHLDKSVDKLSQGVDALKIAVSENHDLVKKIWNALWGGATAVVILWAGIKFILPYIAIG